jgi:CBS domain-containing membrane protein
MPTPDLLERLEQLEAEIVHGLVRRLRLSWLLRRFPPRLVWAGFVFVNGFLSVGLLGAVAFFSRKLFLFPSLGPTAYLFFFKPRAPSASPRNALFGHALALLCGWGALWITGLVYAPSTLQEGVNGRRVLAAALALAATGAALILLDADHPPAGATTLIVALGFAPEPFDLLYIEIAVAVMALQAIAVNRLAGLDYPLWSRKVPSALDSPRRQEVVRNESTEPGRTESP